MLPACTSVGYAFSMSRQTYSDYLKRLPRAYYQGLAYVHWTISIRYRRIGWLTEMFHLKYRELLTHTMFRYGVTCPIYCVMPDHIHLLWIGLFAGSDQLNAMKYFRRHLNGQLREIGYAVQSQSYDNVLREEEIQRDAFEEICDYIARNPERKKLVTQEAFRSYPFTGCLVPGAPELHFGDDGYWDSFWRITSASRKSGLIKNVLASDNNS